ncbi:uncharacterized protein MELLADRAFT_111643 [Melampsora larici-populina 98AG31]|uniref:Uncharacterized protein n=1 Tax=Melampsora larici-populina (strain 98AG31 / pathotype 3-4-7) TaxID=747676 RepID=F4S3V7_MELLP|nr:uncharacterized protein MELLADRAFT_111643 [Melampsora larici-populina 98AG31]EGG00674.1 hypothetical protein MELLADRAFT_111643 [Melampsora larici-populina 98AG31]
MLGGEWQHVNPITGRTHPADKPWDDEAFSGEAQAAMLTGRLVSHLATPVIQTLPESRMIASTSAKQNHNPHPWFKGKTFDPNYVKPIQNNQTRGGFSAFNSNNNCNNRPHPYHQPYYNNSMPKNQGYGPGGGNFGNGYGYGNGNGGNSGGGGFGSGAGNGRGQVQNRPPIGPGSFTRGMGASKGGGGPSNEKNNSASNPTPVEKAPVETSPVELDEIDELSPMLSPLIKTIVSDWSRSPLCSPLKIVHGSNEGWSKDQRPPSGNLFIIRSLPVTNQIRSIKIYGNLTMAENSSITTTQCTRGHRTPAQLLPDTDVEINARGLQVRAEGLIVEDQAVENLQIENLALEAPVRRRSPSVLIAQPPNPRRRRSPRIAQRAELRDVPPYRRPLPSVHEDLDFWSKISTLPPHLLRYLLPGWVPDWTTGDRL